jgi:predicted transposase/invertase (TIGR01784 family)
MQVKGPSIFGDPKTDVIFKRIFGHEKHKDLLIALLNDLLSLQQGRHIIDVTYLTPEQLPAALDAKKSIVDVKCRDQSETEYIVEMQVFNIDGFEKRLVWNSAKAYVNQLDRGDKYPELADVVVIAICNFVLKPERDPDGVYQVGLLSRWHPVDEFSGVKGFGHVRYALLELPKYEAGDHPQTMVEKWAYFFLCAGQLTQVPADLSVPSISKALELARLAGLSRAERERYGRELMAQQDQRGMLSHAQKEGFDEGLAQGKQLGHNEGLAEGLRTAIWAVAELLGIEKTKERDAALSLQSEAQLKDFLQQLKQTRSWNESPAKAAKSRRPA